MLYYEPGFYWQRYIDSYEEPTPTLYRVSVYKTYSDGTEEDIFAGTITEDMFNELNNSDLRGGYWTMDDYARPDEIVYNNWSARDSELLNALIISGLW